MFVNEFGSMVLTRSQSIDDSDAKLCFGAVQRSIGFLAQSQTDLTYAEPGKESPVLVNRVSWDVAQHEVPTEE